MEEPIRDIVAGKKIFAVAKKKKIAFSTIQRYVPDVKISRSIENVKLVTHYDINGVLLSEQ